jgi:hypothetical protein
MLGIHRSLEPHRQAPKCDERMRPARLTEKRIERDPNKGEHAHRPNR